MLPGRPKRDGLLRNEGKNGNGNRYGGRRRADSETDFLTVKAVADAGSGMGSVGFLGFH